MEIVYEGSGRPELLEGSVVTVGYFDGVHLGHQALLADLRQLAVELGCPAVVATFDRHPATVVRPESAPHLLTDFTQRTELLAAAGVDVLYVIRFDEERSLQPPEQFAREVMADGLRARVVLVGQDFHYGRRRRGDIASLSELGAVYGFKVVGRARLESSELVAEPVSSTTIRQALAEGDVDLAARLLGRTYEAHGIVELGDRRGRTIGFPTANVAMSGDMMLPADGVYAGWYRRPSGDTHRAAINIGRRPTFYAEHGMRLLEAHLLDFDDDLYGQAARVTVETRLRGEIRFESVDALVAQLHKDVATVRSLTD